MTTQTASALVDKLEGELNKLCNEGLRFPEVMEKMTVPLTIERAQFHALQVIPFVLNRRDCWAHVAGRAPLDVKQAIWHHEGEELIFDARGGSNHPAMHAAEAISLGCSEEEVANVQPTPQVLAALHGWTILATFRPWLSSLASSHILERQNNDKIVDRGSAGGRWRDKLVRELGIGQEKLKASNVHAVADIEHSDLIWEAIAKHVVDEHSYDDVLQGARESMYMNRAWSAALYNGMRAIG